MLPSHYKRLGLSFAFDHYLKVANLRSTTFSSKRSSMKRVFFFILSNPDKISRDDVVSRMPFFENSPAMQKITLSLFIKFHQKKKIQIKIVAFRYNKIHCGLVLKLIYLNKDVSFFLMLFRIMHCKACINHL